MSSREILAYLRAQPFRPFRIVMNSGRTFDIRHPEMVRVARDCIVLFTYVSEDLEIVDHWETVSLLLVESVQHLDASAA